MHTYQVINSKGDAYWWNSGSWPQEWLLARLQGCGYLVVWDTVVPVVNDDPNGAMRTAGTRLEHEARAG